MSMKLRKCLAVLLSLATVFSSAFTAMADVAVVEEVTAETIDFEIVDEAEIVSVDIQGVETPIVVEVEEVMEETSEINAAGGTEQKLTESLFVGSGITTWADLQTAITNAGTTETTIQLTESLTATGTDSALTISAGQNITLDLNGKTLDRNLSSPATDGNVITVYGKLTLIDTSNEKSGKITGGNNSDGSLSGGVLVSDGGEFAMEGGSITGNRAGYGGGVYVKSNGKMVMTGGSITGNNSTYEGGGVKTGTSTSFTMTGGSITGNTSADNGGGVIIAGTITLGGTAKITDNKKGTGTGATDNNLYLGDDKTVTLGTGEDVPAYGMSVGITTQTPPTVESPVAITGTGVSENDIQYFIADKSDKEEVAYRDGMLVLTEVLVPKTVTLTTEKSVYREGETVTFTIETTGIKDGTYPISLTIDGTPLTGVTITVKDGKATLMETGIAIGKHTAEIELGSAKASAAFEVKKSETTITLATDKSVYTEGEAVTFTAETTGIEDGTYPISLIFDGTPLTGVTITVKDGNATLTETGIAIGKHTVEIEFEGAKASVTFEVKRKSESKSSGNVDDSNEPLFTGTWNNPVKGGSWSQDSNGIWHFTSTEKFKNTWGYIFNPYAHEGQNTADWFWFDSHGNMLTGWQNINGKWYYLNPTKDGTLGACLLGPGTTPDGYEIDETGAWTGNGTAPGSNGQAAKNPNGLFTGTWDDPVTDGYWSIDDAGIWHYTTSQQFRNTWAYIFNPYAHDGQNTSDWFWFDENGNMLTGWQFINGKWYYLHPNKDGVLGSCLIGPGKTPDGYEIDASGARTGR